MVLLAGGPLLAGTEEAVRLKESTTTLTELASAGDKEFLVDCSPNLCA